MIQKSQCRLSLQPSGRKKSLSKPSLRDFGEWHSVVLATWPSPHWSKHAIRICKYPYSLKWGWQNVTLRGSWCYNVNKQKRLSLRSELKKKIASWDPTSQCDMHQNHLLNWEDGILWWQKSNHLQRPNQSEEVWLSLNHMEIKCTPSRMSTWSIYLSYSKRVIDSSFRSYAP